MRSACAPAGPLFALLLSPRSYTYLVNSLSTTRTLPFQRNTTHHRSCTRLQSMAGSRYAYTRTFELPDPLLPSTLFIIRLDGKGFHAFSKAHNFDKPNDVQALGLMNEAARRTMQGRELAGECVVGFGESDEYR